MEGATSQNASRNRNKPRGGGRRRRRKYPALKDQKICLLELPPLIEEIQAQSSNHAQTLPALSLAQTPGQSHAQTVPGPSRVQTVHQIIEDQAPSPIHVQTVPGSSHAQTRGPRLAQTIPDPSRAQTVPGPSRAQTVRDPSRAQIVPGPRRAKTVHHIIEDYASSLIHAQTVPGSSRAKTRGPRLAQTIHGPSHALTIGPSHPQSVHGSSSANIAPGLSHPQIAHGSSSANIAPGSSHPNTSSDQSIGSVIGQEVEGVIDGTFQDGYFISIKIGEIILKGVAYELVANEPGLTPEGQTVQQEIIDLEESPRQDEMHISSQPVAQTVRRVQPRSRIINSGGGTSRNPTKHQDKDQARDVRARGKEKV